MTKSGIQPREPQRMCVICRSRYDKRLLSRHVLGAAGEMIPDDGQKKPGRGFYCCSAPACRARFAVYRPKGKAGKGVGR